MVTPMVAGVRVSISEGSVQYPELVTRQIEMAIASCKQRVIDEGGTFGKVVDGKIVEGEFLEVDIHVTTRYLSEEDIQD